MDHATFQSKFENSPCVCVVLIVIASSLYSVSPSAITWRRGVDLVEDVFEQHRLRLVAAADLRDDGLQAIGDRGALGGAFVGHLDGAIFDRQIGGDEAVELFHGPPARPSRMVSSAVR